MDTESTAKDSAPSKCYRIRIEGSLDPSWSDRLGGLAITTTGRYDRKSTALLEGELADQGALIGLLNTLYEMHLPILSVEDLQPNPAEPAGEISPATD